MKRFLLCSLIILLLTMPAVAGPICAGATTGLPGDWASVALYEDGNWNGTHHNVSAVKFFLYSGDKLVSPGATVGSPWTVDFVDPYQTEISGTLASQSPNFNLLFDDAGATGTATYYYVAFGDGTPDPLMVPTFGDNALAYGLISYGRDNNSWSFQPQEMGKDGFAPAVPEPGSLLLLGSGLIGAAGFIRRRWHLKQ